MSATPRPWFVRINAVDVPDDPDDGTIYEYEIRKPDRSTSGNEHVATAYDKANAALIVKAVNTLDEVTAALTDAAAVLDGLYDNPEDENDVLLVIKAVLAKLEGV